MDELLSSNESLHSVRRRTRLIASLGLIMATIKVSSVFGSLAEARSCLLDRFWKEQSKQMFRADARKTRAAEAIRWRSEGTMHSWTMAAILAFMFLGSNVGAVDIYSDFPRSIDASERYVIYSHGRIVEGTDPRPVHPSWGVYEFPEIKRELFEGGSFNLIAFQRPKDADFVPQSELLESWVRRLVDAGVEPSRITLVGFSRGGHLTAHAAARLAPLGINTAVLGACIDGDISAKPSLVLGGNFLSILEASDTTSSCSKLAERSELISFEEIVIATGKEHGAFYQPRSEWLAPLKSWIAKTNR